MTPTSPGRRLRLHERRQRWGGAELDQTPHVVLEVLPALGGRQPIALRVLGAVLVLLVILKALFGR